MKSIIKKSSVFAASILFVMISAMVTMISAVVSLIYIVGIPMEILVINTGWHGQVTNHIIHQSPAGKSFST